MSAFVEVDDLCPICLSAKVGPFTTLCGHVFCRACLIDSLIVRPPIGFGKCPMCRRRLSLFTARDRDDGRALFSEPAPSSENVNETSPFGRVFVQFRQWGLASYHFHRGGSYISYSSTPLSWTLDDGSRPPVRKSFEALLYDPETRTLTADVSWLPQTFNGDRLWKYTLVFDETFTTIEGGNVETFPEHGGDSSITSFSWAASSSGPRYDLRYIALLPPPLPPEREAGYEALWGSVFVQGPEGRGRCGVASYHFESLSRSYISYSRDAALGWALDDGSAPPAAKEFEASRWNAETRCFQGTITWPQGFNGHKEWRYSLIFSEDYGVIENGTFEESVEVGGPATTHKSFGMNDDREATELRMQYWRLHVPLIDGHDGLQGADDEA